LNGKALPGAYASGFQPRPTAPTTTGFPAYFCQPGTGNAEQCGNDADYQTGNDTHSHLRRASQHGS
jgi:hypothetical protein